MGCSDCSSKGGCDTRKTDQRQLLDAAVARVYPGRPPRWGELDDEARFGAGVPRGEAQRLARRLSSAARAPTRFVAGAPEDLCDFVWVLCLGRRPSLLELADGSAAAVLPEDLPLPGSPLEERWLRVALSSVARMAAMQEVRVTLDLDEAGGRLAIVRQAPRPGVFDPVLLKRVRSIVALLEASDVAHVDFGLLDRPLAGALPGDYPERYGCEPRLANFLFFAAPPSVHTWSAVPLEDRAQEAAVRSGGAP